MLISTRATRSGDAASARRTDRLAPALAEVEHMPDSRIE